MSDENQGKVHGADRGIHEVDGIVEEDNQLPPWWLGTLYATIGFAVLYAGYYLVLDGPTLTQEYERDRLALQLSVAQGGGSGGGELTGLLEKAVGSLSMKQKGGELFGSRCASCHGKAGEGGIGPNLTDAFWLHGAKPVEIARTINEGVLDQGMPPWSASMGPSDVASVTAFIVSLRGSNPPGAKGPQGIEVR
jgi:cytochrome c oxidase cbb3-type subunit 3